MFRRIFILSFLFCLSQIIQIYPDDVQPLNLENLLYLPVIPTGEYQLLKNVDLGMVDYVGEPGTVCRYGYVSGITQTAVYSVTLVVDVRYEITFPYQASSTYTQTVATTLPATLFNQVNPYYYCELYYKGWKSISDARLKSFRLTPADENYRHPLTVTSWTDEGDGFDRVVYGTVMNQSDHRLVDSQIVGLAGICWPIEGDLGAVVLDAGEETTFYFDQFACPPPDPFTIPKEMLELSGQGVEDP